MQFLEQERSLNDFLPTHASECAAALEEYLNDSSTRVKQLQRDADERDAENLTASIGVGVLGGLGGAVSGFLVGLVLAVVVAIGSCISSGHENSRTEGVVLWGACLIGGLIGAIMGYSGKRVKP